MLAWWFKWFADLSGRDDGVAEQTFVSLMNRLK
jgi:hypothetical protein